MSTMMMVASSGDRSVQSMSNRSNMDRNNNNNNNNNNNDMYSHSNSSRHRRRSAAQPPTPPAGATRRGGNGEKATNTTSALTSAAAAASSTAVLIGDSSNISVSGATTMTIATKTWSKTALPAGGKHPKKKIQELLDFMAIQNRTNAPGFSNVLGLTAERLEVKQFSLDNNNTVTPSGGASVISGITTKSSTRHHNNNGSSVTFQYEVPSRLLLSRWDCTTTLSTYLSIIEDVASWAMYLSSSSSKSHQEECFSTTTGSLQADWGPGAQSGLYPGSIVNVTAKVSRLEYHTQQHQSHDAAADATSTSSKHSTATTSARSKKKHRNVDEPVLMIDATIRDAESGQIVCTATLAKYWSQRYLPCSKAKQQQQKCVKQQKRRKFWLKFRLSRWALSIVSKADASANAEPVCPVGLQMTDMVESLDFHTHTSATFLLTSKHANTTGFAPFVATTTCVIKNSVNCDAKETPKMAVHAGCLSIVLEFMGRQVAQDTLAVPMAYLESTHINLSKPIVPISSRIVLEAVVLMRQHHSTTLRIIASTYAGDVIAEGILSYTDSMDVLGSGSTAKTSQNLSVLMGNTTSPAGVALSPAHSNSTGNYRSVLPRSSFQSQQHRAVLSNVAETTEQLASAAIPQFPSNPIPDLPTRVISAIPSYHYQDDDSVDIYQEQQLRQQYNRRTTSSDHGSVSSNSIPFVSSASNNYTTPARYHSSTGTRKLTEGRSAEAAAFSAAVQSHHAGAVAMGIPCPSPSPRSMCYGRSVGSGGSSTGSRSGGIASNTYYAPTPPPRL